MWHKMSVFGKILLFFVGFGFGLALGYKTGLKTVPAQHTSINISDLKTKKGGTIILETKTKQKQEKQEKKSFLKRLFN